jgi:hypothetical protein
MCIMKVHGLWILFAIGLLPAVAFSATWQRNVTLHGVMFTKVRTADDGLHIGEIDTETVVGDRACRPGWLHLHPDGTPAAFTAARDVVLPRVTIPAGTWVMQDASGTITTCALPADTLIQGYNCRGTGGPKGVQVAFYPDGALRQFFPAKPTVIDGVPCATGTVRGAIELHPNGRLKSCLLDRDHVVDGVKYRKGKRLTLAPDGKIQR